MTKYEVINFLKNYIVYINNIHHSINVRTVLIQSGSKVTTFILISAHCLLNMCKVLELSHQVCWHWHDEKEVVETWAKEAIWMDCRGSQAA